MLNIAVLGYGIVGSGVVRLFNDSTFRVRADVPEVYVKYILDIREFPNDPFCDRFVKDFDTIVADKDVTVIVETIGGASIAYDFTKRALQAGISVVTSNKELVSKHGSELMGIAAKNNAKYLFEASVGGGIPIIRPLINCLTANKIQRITGILNGTTNFILTQMVEQGMSFADALASAQKNGYAESNPDADINGIDTCRKTAILASIAYGGYIDAEKIKTEGISNIATEDIEFAEQLGMVIKLIGDSRRVGDKVFAQVYPAMVSRDNLLSSVDNVFNAVAVTGDSVGCVTFCGRGAGDMPTASAVAADVIYAHKFKAVKQDVLWADSGLNILLDEDNADVSFKYYIRFSGKKIDFPPSWEFLNTGGDNVVITDEITYGQYKDVVSAHMRDCEILTMMRVVE